MAYGVLGMEPRVFWDMTYAEFGLALRGYRTKVDQLSTQSWFNAHLNTIGHHQPKKFPKLNTVLGIKKTQSERDRESVKELLSKLPKKKTIKGK